MMIGICHHADNSIDQQSQLISSAPTKNFLFTHPRLFLIFHHHRRKKSPNDISMAQHSKSFDIFHFYDFLSRVNLFLTALTSFVQRQFSLTIGHDVKAMQMINS